LPTPTKSATEVSYIPTEPHTSDRRYKCVFRRNESTLCGSPPTGQELPAHE
jgi:hypothetical protein